MAKTYKKPQKPRWKTYLCRYRPQKWWQWTLTILGILLFLMYSAPLWNPVIFPPVKHPNLGVSFSEKQSQNLGLNWQENFTALLDDLHIKSFRLMSYWDIHEPTRGQYDFSSLDWQVDQATKRGATVTLAIGLRQPRWPECHQPEWANTLNGGAWKQAMYGYIETTVKRYEHNPTVISWQLENEGVNQWFGKCGPPDRTRLKEEYALVDKLSNKQIWMSLSDQHGLPILTPVPDKYGYSVYRTVYSELTKPYVGYITYPTPIWYHRLRALIIKAYTGRDIFIHELQLEPWGPVDTKDLSVAEQDKSMSPQQIGKSVLFAREIGAKDIYTWGGEWWYWRLKHGDPTIWNTVKQTFNDAEQ
jgi:hypothetical protein